MNRMQSDEKRRTLMRNIVLVLALGGLVALTSSADAASCSIRGTSRTCEITCAGTCSGGNHAICDSNADGYCTLCGQSGTQTIFGTSGKDWICGKGGDDNLYGAPLGTSSSDDDVIAGDGGHDFIQGGSGDDELVGGSGDDVIRGGEGTNALLGGTGDDDLDNSQSSRWKRALHNN
jgi:hypothetical protein